MEKIELRQIDVELRGINEEDGKLKVSGYVNRTGEWSQPLGREKRFIERIMPGTFTRALQKGNDVDFLAEHDNSKLLASTKNGSLNLREDDNGLFMEAEISPTSWGKDYHQLIKDGLLTNMSFGMAVGKDDWKKRSDGLYERSIEDISLVEVSAVKNPAYVTSTIQARSLDIQSEEDVLFLMQKNNKNEKDELNMDKEKQLKELRATLEALETEQRAEAKALAVEVRTEVPAVDPKETETRTVEKFLRGDIYAPEVRAITTGATPGSATIPTHLSNVIVEKLNEYAPLFARTKNFTPVNGFLEILREQAIGNAGFFGEMNTQSMTSDFTMDKVRLDQKRVGTAIELSQHLVNDSGIDVVNYAIGILSRRLGITLDDSILNGDKATQFEGVVLDANDKIEKVETEAVGAITIDDIFELYNTMHPEHQANAVFVMARSTFNEIAKLKDENGHYFLVRDIATTGLTYSIFGRPVLINDNMPPFGAGLRSIVFANFGEGYATITKKGLNLKRISDDTTQALRGSQLLVLDAYMDGKILNPDAIKLLQVKSA
ncbi:phage major capsid protein [Ureibacillus aquaedulcis]|uniref:Phage major capsid protein n=1 Tax=Ureibacillus aquaedulcis TaxID=3058421 RepID=A0ABT8GNA7_9BACL|nr:phage major capsid protein [Ureibacillus sp. BA0131]MDN4492890.1 phage major capsid protein [Ureibacillus sp. BA0131]